MLTPIYLDMRTYYHKFGRNIRIFKMLCTNYMASSEVMTSSTHSFAYIHIDWSINILWKFAKLQSVITSLFVNQFSSGFHCYVWNFLLFLLKFKLNLFRISPLQRNICDEWNCDAETSITALIPVSLKASVQWASKQFDILNSRHESKAQRCQPSKTKNSTLRGKKQYFDPKKSIL